MKTQQEIRSLQKKIDTVKKKLMALGNMHPGTLSEQYNICGKKNCRCKADPPEKHGPYYQVSFRLKGKSSSRFVKKQFVPAVTKQLSNYKTLKDLVDQWVILSTRISTLETKEIKK